MDQGFLHIYSVYVSKVFQNWAHICSNVQDLLPVKVCTITSQAGSNSPKPWSSLQIHKKNTPVGQRNFGAVWWERQKNQECHSRTPQLSAYVQPTFFNWPTSPNSRAQIQRRTRANTNPGQERKSYWVSHARNLLISQSQHCSHPVPEQNVLCPILNHHQVTERSREPLYHAQAKWTRPEILEHGKKKKSMQLLFLFVSVQFYARFFKHRAIKDYWTYYSMNHLWRTLNAYFCLCTRLTEQWGKKHINLHVTCKNLSFSNNFKVFQKGAHIVAKVDLFPVRLCTITIWNADGNIRSQNKIQITNLPQTFQSFTDELAHYQEFSYP